MLRMVVGRRLTSQLQPVPHEFDLVRLRNRHAKAQLTHVVVLGVAGQQICHVDRLQVVVDHALHEFDVRSGGLDFRQVGGLFRGNLPAGCSWRSWLDEQRMYIGARGMACSETNGGRKDQGFHQRMILEIHYGW